MGQIKAYLISSSIDWLTDSFIHSFIHWEGQPFLFGLTTLEQFYFRLGLDERLINWLWRVVEHNLFFNIRWGYSSFVNPADTVLMERVKSAVYYIQKSLCVQRCRGKITVFRAYYSLCRITFLFGVVSTWSLPTQCSSIDKDKYWQTRRFIDCPADCIND